MPIQIGVADIDWNISNFDIPELFQWFLEIGWKNPKEWSKTIFQPVVQVITPDEDL
jgi:hypothetical protein